MKIVILLQKTPTDYINQIGYRYVLSAIKKNHTIACIFFYGDAIYHALTNPEENSVPIHWHDLNATYGIPLLCCQTALNRRGIFHLEKTHYTTSQMDIFLQQSLIADKVITF